MVKCAWLIFSRSNSNRLPNKCYFSLKGNIMVELILENLRRSGVPASHIFLCTSTHPNDDELAQIATRAKISLLRGSEQYPIKRYSDNIDQFVGFDYISRINGDSPLYSSELPLKALKLASETLIYPDIITNLRLRNFPSGLSIELYKQEFLNNFLADKPSRQYYEHMSDYIAESKSDNAYICDIYPTQPLDQRYFTKLTIDEFSDYQRISSLYISGEAAMISKYYSNIDVRLASSA